MSFDDLFTLLLFIVFIGLPLLNRMQQRGGGTRPGAPPPGRAQRPGAPAPPPAPGAGPPSAGAEARRRDEGGARPAPTPERDDDPFAELARRLEEARRRVREASQGTSGQASASTTSSTTAPSSASAGASEPRRTIATPAPPSAPIPDPRAGAAPRPRADRDPFPKARPRPDAPWRAERGSVPRNALTEEAPALEVQRGRSLSSGSDRRTREVARLRAQELVALDAQSFRKGIMWHMVLTGPVAHRNRRKPSLPASR